MKHLLITLILILSITACKEDTNLIDSDSDLFEDLFVYYNFDSDGNDQSEKQLNAELNGNISLVEGIKGNAIYLNNPRNDEFAHNAWVQLPEFDYSNDFTLSYYMKFNFSSAENTRHATYIWTAGAQVMSGNDRGYTYQLGVRTNHTTHNKLSLFGGNSNEHGFITSDEIRPSIDDNNWHHILLRKSNNTIEFYFDNTIIETVTIPSELSFDNYYESFLGKHQWIQGGSMNRASRYNGYIDEFFLFERAVGDEEITKLYELEY